MIQGIVICGTTPTHDFELPYPVELIKDIRIIYGQNEKAIITKTLKDCTFAENSCSVQLSQEDTFAFTPNKKLFVEIRILTTDGQVSGTEEPVLLKVLGSMDTEVMA